MNMKYRVWDGKKMWYPEDSDGKWHISLEGHVLEEDVDLDDGYQYWSEVKACTAMMDTGWKSNEVPIYVSDVVRDCDGYLGVVIWWEQELCFGIKFADEILSLSEFPKEDSLQIAVSKQGLWRLHLKHIEIIKERWMRWED